MTPRVYTDMPFAAYVELDGWNWSTIKLVDSHSLAHVAHARKHRYSGDTASRKTLRAIHAATLEPRRFDEQFPIYRGDPSTGKKPSRNSNHYRDWKALLPEGVTDRKQHEIDHAKEVGAAIMADRWASPWLQGGHPEIVIQWQDEATNLLCKMRADYLVLGERSVAVSDLKSITTIARHSVGSLISRNRWYAQLTHYACGARAAIRAGVLPDQATPWLTEGWGSVDARIVVVEEKHPVHDVGVFRLRGEQFDDPLCCGERYRAELMATLADAVARDYWPGRYTEKGEQDAELQDWAKGLDDIETDVDDGEWQEL